MRNKSWFKYLIYIILLCIVIFIKDKITASLYIEYKKNASGNYYLLLIIPFLMNILIGMFIGLEHYVKEIKSEGTMGLNLPKFILMGVPSLVFSLTYVFATIHNEFVQKALSILASNGTTFISVFQILLGYVIITSFDKRSKGKIPQPVNNEGIFTTNVNTEGTIISSERTQGVTTTPEDAHGMSNTPQNGEGNAAPADKGEGQAAPPENTGGYNI